MKTFKEIVDDVKSQDNKITDGHICQIISIMTKEKKTKSKKDKLYTKKYKTL